MKERATERLLFVILMLLSASGSLADDDTSVVLPEEIASDDDLATLSDWFKMPVFAPRTYVEFSSYDRMTGAPVPIDLAANGNRDVNNFVCKSEDADIQENPLFPLIFDLAACPESYTRGVVLARVEGAGRSSRIQIVSTSFVPGETDAKILRIYVDEKRKPVLQVPYASVLRGEAGALFARPFSVGSPYDLVWYYPVTFNRRFIVTLDAIGPNDLIFYQVDVVKSAEDRHAVVLPYASPARAAAQQALSLPPQSPDPATFALASVQLVPGSPVRVLDLAGPATIREVTVQLARADVPRLNEVVVDAYWNGSTASAIHQPLGTLFNAALDLPDSTHAPIAGQPSGDSYRLSLRLPMPFSTQARWVFTNQGSQPLTMTVGASGESSVPGAPFGTLRAHYADTVGPTNLPSHSIATLTGRGRYVGTCLMLEGHALPPTSFFSSPFNFLEGDLTATIDGTLAVRGSGAEDYVNSTLYFRDGPYANAFGEAYGITADVSGTVPRGRVSACRWHVLGDAVDFEHSLDVKLEIGPGDPSLLDRYRSTAFYYQ